MSSRTQALPTQKQSRWRKWTVMFFLLLGFLFAVSYGVLFIRIVPPRSVRLVDAVTGKPIPGMNVCIQAVSHWVDQTSTRKRFGDDGRKW